jgi:flagellar motor protein MotB
MRSDGASALRAARSALAAIALLAGALTLSCATTELAIPRLAEIDRTRETPSAKEAAELAPQAFAHAETERAEARKAQRAGDQVAALLYADRAVAAYNHAFVLARLARATQANDEAQAALATAAEETRTLASSRQQVDEEGSALDVALAVVREAQPPIASGPTDEKREMARLVATRALVAEARLLCGAARLVQADAPLGDVDKEVGDLDAQIEAKPHPAPIDAAARVRAKCLERLTTARRASAGAMSADELLSELSASGGLDPSRDERGVVVRLRDLFEGTRLAKKAEPRLAELGRIAAAHPDVAVQVVVHDAVTPSRADAAADAQRADAVVQALIAAGAKAEQVKGETAGVKAPIVDPGDAAHRALNARVDLVFVTK